MARVSKLQSQATAARIMETAQRMFAASGFAAVGLDEVAAESGVTRGAVYNHFGSKRGLFLVVFDRTQQTVAEAVGSAADRHEDLWDGFLSGCRAFLVASLDPSVRRIMLVDAPAVLGWEEWNHADASNSGRLLEEGLAELAGAGMIEADRIAETGALLSGAMNGAALSIVQSEDRDRALDRSWTVLERMIAAVRVS